MKTSLGSGRVDTAMPCGAGWRGRDAIVVASCDWMRWWSFLPALWVLLERLKYHRKGVPSRRSAPNSSSKAFGPHSLGAERHVSGGFLGVREGVNTSFCSKERRKTKKKVGHQQRSLAGGASRLLDGNQAKRANFCKVSVSGSHVGPRLFYRCCGRCQRLCCAAMVEWNVVEVRMAGLLILQVLENCWSSAEGLWCWFWDHHDQYGDRWISCLRVCHVLGV